jgi:hypothetical protein
MPAVEAVYTLYEFSDKQQDERDFRNIIAAFASHAISLKEGDLSDTERLLMAQPGTLDVTFNRLVRLAATNIGQHLPAVETYLRNRVKRTIGASRQ